MKPTLKIASILVLISLFSLLPLVSAQAIQDFSIEIQISGQKALVSYEIQTEESQIQMNLPPDAEITDSSANYTLKNSLITAEVKDNRLALEYETKNLIESNKYFTADFQIPETENLAVRLILPESATLDKAFPNPELTSDGKHIILDWKSKNTNDFPVFIVYNEKKGIALQWLIVILAIIALISAILILKRKAKVKAKPKLKAKKPAKELHLLESENAVIRALKGGAVWQKQIQLKTGFSKAKLSRTIRNLEARKLVKRIPLGNTNKIKLIN
jgi:uncharacterized membrane protein